MPAFLKYALLTLCSLTISLILTWGLKYSSKKKGQQKKGKLIVKYGTEASLQANIGIWRKFHTEHVCFFIFFGDKKE